MVRDMISSLGAYEVMSFYWYFVAMLLGFDGLRRLVELEGFSPNNLVLCKWNSESS